MHIRGHTPPIRHSVLTPVYDFAIADGVVQELTSAAWFASVEDHDRTPTATGVNSLYHGVKVKVVQRQTTSQNDRVRCE